MRICRSLLPSGNTGIAISVFVMLVLAVQRDRSLADDQQRLVLRGEAATVGFSLQGGAMIEFRLNEHSLNPLNWEVSTDADKIEAKGPRPQGHFLCFDRWGAPSAAEANKGIPFHGEAPYTIWKIQQPTADKGDWLEAEMSCELPLTAMKVERRMFLSRKSSALVVTEKVTNTARLGRLYNLVQHPTIAPPFLDDQTIVDSNAQQGFSQQGPVPDSNSRRHQWPQMQFAEGMDDLRHFRGDGKDGHDVSSFVFSENSSIGWVTACHPAGKLLLGYLWQTVDYPWLNIWRYRDQSKVAARGLEFGTTGYHQPFPILVRQHRILDRPLYDYLDADESHERSYVAFISAIPEDFRGVASVSIVDRQIRITEVGAENARRVEVLLSKLPWVMR